MSEQNTDKLLTSVQFVKGVGPRRAALLEKLGLLTVQDLLFCVPRSYQDLTDVRPISKLEPNKLQTVRGQVVDIDSRSGRRKSITIVLIQDETGLLKGNWFNQPNISKRFQIGSYILFSGKPTMTSGTWEMSHPQTQFTDSPELDEPLLPIYPLTEQLRIHDMRRIIRNALEAYSELISELLPQWLVQEQQLPNRTWCVKQVHFPKSLIEAKTARDRLVFEELTMMQIAVALQSRDHITQHASAVIEVTPQIDERIRALFAFKFTGDQDKSTSEIVSDLSSGKPMNRLLEGDVGTGKTAVAFYAILASIANKYQAALMAPTEVLANQHRRNIERYLAQSRVRTAYLSGSVSSADRKRIIKETSNGEIDLVIGTQAIIQSDVQFANLGLVVVDEQHKFGVRQRARIRSKGLDPHYLLMTATPIPRTLAMSVFGDLDVSTIREQPPGRVPVRTYVVPAADEKSTYDFIIKKIREGRQAYVICPLVDESEAMDLQAATTTVNSLGTGVFKEFNVGLLHGRMDDQNKEELMRQFREGGINVLVSTLVVEVGVDVPNATIMAVLDAHRFGLSQLHQLRGRVCRGLYPGVCFLIHQSTNDTATQRMQILENSTDGFEIAEEDLKMRGPGEFLGTRQHGLPVLQVADLIRDADILFKARDAAHKLVARDPNLSAEENMPLLREIIHRFGSSLQFAGVS